MAINICTFAVLLFLLILLSQPILFHITAVEEHCMHGYCVLLKSLFLSRAATFVCGLANWSCMSRSVKGDMLQFVTHVLLIGLLYP